jgi:hypothetical protein
MHGFWLVEDSCSTGLEGVMQWQKMGVWNFSVTRASVLEEEEGTNNDNCFMKIPTAKNNTPNNVCYTVPFVTENFTTESNDKVPSFL